MMLRSLTTGVLCAVMLITGCKSKSPSAAAGPAPSPAAPAQADVFQVDQATAGSITGSVRDTGRRPALKSVDMSEDPACVAAHKGKAVDESLVVGPSGAVSNAFIYVKAGLEGKHFATPTQPVVIDQSGCWFRPRVLGLQTNQPLQVDNSDPVTHNIHPQAQANREWNHSQGPGDPPIVRRFTKPEIMIPVKCNIHSWMHAWIGVLDHPYFAVSASDGSFTIRNLPPGTYTVAIWHEKLGTQEQQVVVPAHGKAAAAFTFR